MILISYVGGDNKERMLYLQKDAVLPTRKAVPLIELKAT
jgi:hypothetical protein